MASYRKLKPGCKATVSKRINGKLKQISKNGFSTKNEARLWATSIEADESIGTIKASKSITFEGYFKTWYDTYKAPKISRVTLDRYRIIHKQLKEYFGKAMLADITRQAYQRFINFYGSGHAKDTVYKLHALVKACIKSVLLDEIITKDFTEGIELVFNSKKHVQVEYLEIDELKALAKHTEAGLNPHFTSRYMILTAIYTGMRIGEIMALTWDDIDFDKQTISITKSWDYVHGTGFKPTKTESSVRTIKVSRELLAALSRLKINQNKMVFANQYGTISSSNAVNKTLRSLLKDCGLDKKNYHFHSLRHTHVAYLLAQGIDLYIISKRLGHSDMTITAKRYAYLLKDYNKKIEQQIINATDNLLS